MTEHTWTSCCVCGIKFGVPADWLRARRKDGEGFRCPNGHSLCFDSEDDKILRERDRLKQRLAQKDDEIAAEREKTLKARQQTAAQKGVVTKLKKRVSGGVCPCCNRTFQNLARHMGAKHPDYSDNVVKLKTGSQK